ncbi:hypothetical protein I5G67_gp086 [Mycobacterium phage Aminay]|uniref:Uncharacterized protein n=1 Tax=Mycobacterium phage Aminay TaxID=2250291 RepID=A0A345KV70_9CAUD|nr:hypothetical protein I5G67_gp086 [Mycobacterium phage Aminay]AXH46922.1 hypothetical protein SEA_AMINAY_86 [Mycobacterium phage Aminay]
MTNASAISRKLNAAGVYTSSCRDYDASPWGVYVHGGKYGAPVVVCAAYARHEKAARKLGDVAQVLAGAGYTVRDTRGMSLIVTR